MSEKHTDDVTGVETTGHSWDGIRELNNPLPKWWIYTFYVSIAWAVAYWIVMPAWPYLTGDGWTYTKGVIGYEQREVVTDELAAIVESRSGAMERIASLPLEEIANDPALMEVALGAGKAAFGDNCAPCHGSGAQGSKGFPNLNDDDWIWGGTLDDIHTTLAHGIRWDGDDDTRFNIMMAYGSDGILNRDEISDVAEYVLSLSGRAGDQEAAARGSEVFASQCIACHGDDGSGNQELGAPNLTDAIWLYGGDKEAIVKTVSNGRSGVMPAWNERLDEGTINSLTLFVYSLGGGEK
ncbi:cytochrome-c oxidase, cbb3-type subunit III [Parvibaculum sp.]|jgi:cytochrome c oxidase cbb3-type subunit III|uniref:cytochrome-c oxidase, cbb3-type subunit III n=1 Tax=Parvibaculum sp. TaxID=2024848 RepID=UPI000C520D7E|nr:cytochrome-c oxidase, cbb3-type subunit III [Parvibaculum sp.]MAM93042.1 cytochrome-c oxidase, cbb3-type subunit III [Parvibaculum sp.]|tara:strand:- start:23144 stop:24028 length:885 start_codon:yes stop_codon:yes gene_type:complete